MPPYTPNVSKAQERKMFVLEDEGKLAPGEAEGKARATKGNFHHLPQHVHHAKKSGHRPSVAALSHLK